MNEELEFRPLVHRNVEFKISSVFTNPEVPSNHYVTFLSFILKSCRVKLFILNFSANNQLKNQFKASLKHFGQHIATTLDIQAGTNKAPSSFLSSFSNSCDNIGVDVVSFSIRHIFRHCRMITTKQLYISAFSFCKWLPFLCLPLIGLHTVVSACTAFNFFVFGIRVSAIIHHMSTTPATMSLHSIVCFDTFCDRGLPCFDHSELELWVQIELEESLRMLSAGCSPEFIPGSCFHSV